MRFSEEPSSSTLFSSDMVASRMPVHRALEAAHVAAQRIDAGDGFLQVGAHAAHVLLDRGDGAAERLE